MVKRIHINTPEYERKTQLIEDRLERMLFGHGYEDADVKRIVDRLCRSMEDLLPFLQSRMWILQIIMPKEKSVPPW